MGKRPANELPHRSTGCGCTIRKSSGNCMEIYGIKRFLSNVHDIVDLGKLSQETVLKLISVRSICQKINGASLVEALFSFIFQQLKANRNLGNKLVRNCPSSIFLICEVHFVVYPTSNMLNQTLHPVAIKLDDLGLVTLGPTKSESLCFLVVVFSMD